MAYDRDIRKPHVAIAAEDRHIYGRLFAYRVQRHCIHSMRVPNADVSGTEVQGSD